MPAFDFAIEQVTRIHDGDTATVLVDLGFGAKYEVDVRLEGLDTPELKGVSKKAGEVSRVALAKWLTDNQPKLRLFSKKWDKYGGRALGSIYIDGQRTNTAAAFMISSKFGKPYDGKKKVEWTKAELAAVEARD